MSTTIPKQQTRFSGTLTREFNATASGSLYLQSSKTLSITEGYIVVNPSNSKAESMKFTTKTGTTTEYTLGISIRGLQEYGSDTNVSGNQKAHNVGDTVIISDDYNWLQRVIDAFNTHEDLVAAHGSAGTGLLSAIPSAASNNTKLYFATDALAFYYSDGSTWTVAPLGSVSDASTSVKGATKLSVAPVSATSPIAVGDNDTRLLDSTSTNATGQVKIGSLGSGNRAATLSLHGNDTNTSGDFIIARASSGVNATATITHRGTGTLTLSLAEAATFYLSTGAGLFECDKDLSRLATAGETITAGQTVFWHTDGSVYKSDNTTIAKAEFFGFASTSATVGQPIFIQQAGIISGTFTAGSTYYISGTAGSVTATAPVNNSASIVPVVAGYAVQTNVLLIKKQRIPRLLAQTATYASGTGNGTQTVTVGFPMKYVKVSTHRREGDATEQSGVCIGFYDVLSGTQGMISNNANLTNPPSTTQCAHIRQTSGSGSMVAVGSVSSNNFTLAWTVSGSSINADMIIEALEAI